MKGWQPKFPWSSIHYMDMLDEEVIPIRLDDKLFLAESDWNKPVLTRKWHGCAGLLLRVALGEDAPQTSFST
jgi:hypothetical protein